MIVRMDFINSAINWLREKRMPALVSKEKEFQQRAFESSMCLVLEANR